MVCQVRSWDGGSRDESGVRVAVVVVVVDDIVD